MSNQCLHRCHLALATCHHINHLARELLGNVDCKLLDRLTLLSVNLLVYNLRLTYLKLVALASHCLDKHREVEHTTSAYNPLVGGVLEGAHTQGKILLKLLLQTVVDVA